MKYSSEELIQKYISGKSINQIASETGFSKQYVSLVLRKNPDYLAIKRVQSNSMSKHEQTIVAILAGDNKPTKKALAESLSVDITALSKYILKLVSYGLLTKEQANFPGNKGQKHDYAGQTIGNWLLIKRLEDRFFKTPYYLAKCLICNTSKSIGLAHIRSKQPVPCRTCFLRVRLQK